METTKTEAFQRENEILRRHDPPATVEPPSGETVPPDARAATDDSGSAHPGRRHGERLNLLFPRLNLLFPITTTRGGNRR